MTPAEMREMAAKVADNEGGDFTWSGEMWVASKIAAAIRAIPIPDTTAADYAPVTEPYQIIAKDWLPPLPAAPAANDVLATARDALVKIDSKRREARGTNYLGRAGILGECLDIAREALAAIDAAKAKGGG